MKKDLLSEQSLKHSDSTNIGNCLIPLYEDVLSETNSVTGIASYKRLMTDVIKRYYEVAPIEYLASYQETGTPNGRIFTFNNRLSGNSEQHTLVTDDLKIFKLKNSFNDINIGDSITNGTATAEVIYAESPFVLVKIESGTFIKGDSIGTNELLGIYNAIHLLGTFLPNYVGTYTIDQDAEVIDFRQVDFIMGEATTNTKIKKTKTGLTIETLKDLVATFGIKYRPVLIDIIVQVMMSIELNDIFRYQRANAYNKPNLVLTNSYGINNSLSAAYEDIWNRINNSIGSIGGKGGITGSYSVSASSNVVAALKTLLKQAIYLDENGILTLPGGVSLIEDGYSLQDYFCVTLVGPNDNSAMVFAPYDLQVIEAQNPEDFSKHIVVIDRFDVLDNPLVTRVNDQAKNELMEITFVDFNGLNNF